MISNKQLELYDWDLGSKRYKINPWSETQNEWSSWSKAANEWVSKKKYIMNPTTDRNKWKKFKISIY